MQFEYKTCIFDISSQYKDSLNNKLRNYFEIDKTIFKMNFQEIKNL